MLSTEQMLKELFLQPLLIFAKIPGHSRLSIKMGDDLTTRDITPSCPRDLLPLSQPQGRVCSRDFLAGKAMDTDLCPWPEATLD